MPNPQIPAAATGLPKSTEPQAGIPAEAGGKNYDEEYAARKFEERKHFEQLYSNWLKARSDSTDSKHWDAEDDEKALTLRNEREDEAARLLFITPAVLPFHVEWKMGVFEHYLFADADSQWTDKRQIAFFGCIKADLARFGIGEHVE